MALTQVSQYDVWPSLAAGESKTNYSGQCYQWLDTSNKNYAIRLEWYIAQNGSTYYKIYFRSFLVVRVGWSINFSGNYSLKLNSKYIVESSDGAFSSGSLKPTTGSKNGSGTQTEIAYYLISQDTYTIRSANSSTIGLNGTGYNINSMILSVNFNGTKLSGTTYNNITASKVGSPIYKLPPIVTASAANIIGLSVTGGFKSLSVLWSTDSDLSSNAQYSLNGGSTWTTTNNGSGTNQGSFAITGLSPGTSYTVTLRVERNGLYTTKSASDSTYEQPSITLNSTDVEIGIGDKSKSISVDASDDHSYCYLRAKVFLSDGTAISDYTNISVGSNSIPLYVDIIKNNVNESSSFYVALYSYTDSGYTNTAYSTIYSDNGTITIDYSDSNITFNDDDFIVTSSTADYTVNGGTLGNRLLIRSLSQISVKLNSLATTVAGELSHTIEIRNSSDRVIKTATITNTNTFNLGAITSAGTYSAVLTIYNATYDKSKVVTIENIYVSEYSNPSVFATVVKTASSGTLLMTVSAQYSTIKNISGSNVNLLKTFDWYYKNSASSNWTYGGDLSSFQFTLYGTTYQLENQSGNITGFNSSYNYNFKFVIEDSINSFTYELNAAEAGSIIRILENGQVGINASPDTTSTNILTVGGDTLIQGTASAKSHANISIAELKTDIVLFDKNVEDIILNTDVYNYKYKDDVENGNDIERIGFIIGDDYNTYEGIINENHNAIDLYSCIGILWKSQQKIYEELKKIKEQLPNN